MTHPSVSYTHLNALVRLTFSMAGTLNSAYPFYLGIMLMPMCFALLTIVVDAVFSAESKYGTLQNTISFGISRAEIYFGKLIVEIILMLVTLSLIHIYIAQLQNIPDNLLEAAEIDLSLIHISAGEPPI